MNILKGPECLQGSTEWIDWRRTHITGTDAYVILGEGIKDNPLNLWKRKLGILEEKELTDEMKIGTILEPECRTIACTETSHDYQPAVVESETHPWAGVSLDGLHEPSNSILEIKCGKKNHLCCLDNVLVHRYFIQIQHALFVTGCDYCLYYSYDPTHSQPICAMHVLREQSFIDWMVPKLYEFWLCLMNLKEPY